MIDHTIRYYKRSVLCLMLALVIVMPLRAQWQVRESVLNRHTWYKIGVTEDGIYELDYAWFQSLGLDVQGLNPDHLRLFGNKPGVLPEKNSEERFDDLSEVAIQVIGGDDGSFDANDKVLFYGSGPVQRRLTSSGYYLYERNPYSDTVYYFLCVDDDVPGLRIQEKETITVSEDAPIIDSYIDYYCHESEELSPFASGRTWYGDLITSQEGYLEFQIEVPELINDKPMWIESVVLGRCKKLFTYNLRVNECLIVNEQVINDYKDHEYGKEHKALKMFTTDSTTINVRYELNPNNSNPMLFNDYFGVSYWRTLRFHEKELAFGLTPMQLEPSGTKVLVDGTREGVTCWDVTDPIRPVIQPMTMQPDGVACFGSTDNRERRFHLFEPEGVKQIASCRPVSNQNLHGIDGAEMLVVTPRVFWKQSLELAEFHRVNDTMDCVVVDVAEIFNEFGTGIGDPTAIRDFIRMVYFRSDGDLKYVLLMGKGTHDYRNIKGVSNNFMPIYELRASPYHEVSSMSSDDYYALMDVNEGEDCTGKVDLGIGRLPITTPEQGDAIIAKIKHYADLSAVHGPWKNSHLFMADNDNKMYVNYAEDLEKIVDTTYSAVTSQKLYIDSYPVVNTTSGVRVPKANEALMSCFDKGFGMMSYTGHGGTKSLTSEWVLSISDIMGLENYDRLPFIHTATCEFSKFDNPNIVSGGELLMLNPRGGAIAMMTTMRPTYAPTNQSMSKAVHSIVYGKDGKQGKRFGDIYRIAKSNPAFYSKSNIVYVLFGDPALRFSLPLLDVRTVKVNGAEIASNQEVVTGETTEVEGVVTDANGIVDTMFNGVVDVRIYDRKTRFRTLGQYTDPVDYTYYNDVLFEGKATVKNGCFSFRFPAPSEASHGQGAVRVSYYAYDSIRCVDANGVFDKIVLDDDPIVDNQGPDIHLYWNSPDFTSGDVVNRRGVLYADLYDEHGIYHYNISIGRDMVLGSSLSEYNNLILNDVYEPAIDDYQRGRIALPIEDLENGTYCFSLKAWDTQNNSSEVEIYLSVEQGAMMAQVHNYPNPFKDETWFSFMHGDMNDELSVVIEVFDVLGHRVAMLETVTVADGGVVPPIRWDGLSSEGRELLPGIYVYKMCVTNSEGKSRYTTQRLVKQ